MVIDIEAVLHRVVRDVFGTGVEVSIAPAPRDRGAYQAHLASLDGLRQARLTANSERFDLYLLDLDVSTGLIEYDDDAHRESCVRALALLARAHMQGEGRMERRRGYFRSYPVWVVEVDGREWVLGRRVSWPQYPE